MNPFDKLGEAQIRASELTTCIYCPNALPSRGKEHLFSACCGGTHKSSQLICDDCNQAFSSLDPAFAQYARFIMNAWGFMGDRHRKIPVVSLEGDCELGPLATPRLKKPEMSVTALPDGTHAIKVTTSTKGEAKHLLFDGDNLEKAVGHKLTDAQKDAIRKQISTAQSKATELGPSTFKAKLCFNDEFRLAAHTILKCAALYDPKLVRDEVTKPIREFARYDIGKVEDFAVVTVQNLSPLSAIQRVHGVFQNTALVYWSKTERKIIGVFRLLGRIQRSVVLAEDYSGPDAFLSVHEAVRGSPKPRAMFAQLRTEVMPVPLIEIVARPPAFPSLVEDFSRLTRDCMVDSILARLQDKLQQLTSSAPLTLDQVTLIEHALATALTECARAMSQTLSMKAARALLNSTEAGTELKECLGQPSNSIAVLTTAARLFREAAMKLIGPPSATTVSGTSA